MSKRDRRNVHVWDDNPEVPPLSPEAVAAQGYGDLGALTAPSGKIVAVPLNIFDITSDLTQPRRSMPSEVRSLWDGTPSSLADTFIRWWELAQGEQGIELDLRSLLEQIELPQSESESPYRIGSIEASLLAIVRLAASIRRDGLTNPITVARSGTLYQLETGERRWLAYHLLHALFQDEKWLKIPARIVDRPNVWRQATENTARQDLNAIGKARQYATLMMDLYSQPEYGGTLFTPYNDCATDREYYAQILQYDRVPYGKRDELLNTIGAKTPTALTRCRKLLQLPNEVWTVADDFNLPEDRLLDLVDLPEEEAVAQARQIAGIVPTRNDWDNPNNPTRSQNPPTPSGSSGQSELFSPDIPRNFKKMFVLGVKAGQGDRRARDKFLSQIEDHRRWLDAVEQSILEAGE